MDSLKEWPQPIVRVQAVSESGVTVIPDRYIKPPSQRPCRTSTSTESELCIPVIDLGKLDSLHDTVTVKEVAKASREWGFFQVVNHGVSHEVMDRIMEAWKEFFHSPMEEKQVYANSPKTYEGYGSRLGIEKGAILDWGDYFFLHLLPQSLKKTNKWPHIPSNLKDTVEEYGREVVEMCGKLLKVLSLGLGLDEDYFMQAFGRDGIGACTRTNYYPKCPQPELTLGLSSHSDPGGMTALLADSRVKGLQVRKGDNWVTVQPLPHAFIINIGDQIQVLSNGIYRSVEHRVTANAEAERLSIAFFYNPKSDLPLGPAPALVTEDRPAMYRTMTFDEYRLYIRLHGPQGKSHVDSLKSIERCLSS